MQETHDIRNRTFSFGAHGYNQDDVDRYLRELADRLESADVDWHSELRRLEAPSFAVVSLGYWRPDVDSYMAELRAWMGERAGATETNGTAPEPAADAEAESEPQAEARAEAETPAEPTALQSGWSQGIVERLRRVTEASTAPTSLADVVERPVPEVVAAAPRPLPQETEAEAEQDHGATETDRVRLFRMAVALGVEDAVSMTAEDLVAAIDRVQAGEEPEAAEAAVEPVDDPSVALARTKATLASFERMLADQVSQVTAAARLERESAARRAETIVRDAERRAGEIVAAAEREGDALEDRAQRYSERVRRMADREALRRAAAVEEQEPAETAPETAAAPEPEVVAEATPGPEMAAEPEAEPEPEPEAEEPEMGAEEEPDAEAADEPAAEAPQQVSRWDRLRRAIG
ncbi:MAG TPA: DivIVA domain-containing protein [Gaiellales bacterium]|nr:DivIVA domain-containing protein [Gaiellales bacterium]